MLRWTSTERSGQTEVMDDRETGMVFNVRTRTTTTATTTAPVATRATTNATNESSKADETLTLALKNTSTFNTAKNRIYATRFAARRNTASLPLLPVYHCEVFIDQPMLLSTK